MVDLAKMKAEYINSKTNVSYKSIALQYGVSFQQVRYRATKDKWHTQREAIRLNQDVSMAEPIEPTEPTEPPEILASPKSVETITELATNKLYIILNGDEVGAGNIKSLTAALKDLHSIQQSTKNNDSEGKLPDIVEALRGVED